MTHPSTQKLQNIAKQAIYLAILFILLAMLFMPQSMTGINIFDEGFIVSGAMLVQNGMLPYRDFLSMYGPGQYYVTAALFSVLGEDLRFVRFLHVALLATLGMAIYLLAKKSSEGVCKPLLLLLAYVGIVLFAQPNVGYPAITASLFLLFSAFALSKWVDTLRANSLVLASSMIGIAGLFRWDFGVFGLLALTLTMTFVTLQEKINTGRSIHFINWLFAAIVPAMLIMVAIYIPLLVIFSSPVRWYQEVPLFSLTEFVKWRNLEFIRPALCSLLASRSAIAFGTSALKLAYLGIPIALVVGAISSAAYVLVRRVVKPIEKNRLILIVYLAFLCMCLLNQMRVRPGLWQGFPALVVSLPLIVLLLDYYKTIIARSKPLTIALNIIGFFIGALLFNAGHQGLLQTSGKRHIAFNTLRSSGIRVEPELKPYIDLVKYVQANTKPDEPIYSGVQDHSRLFINDAMLYFLTNRPPADRFLELEPGIANTLQGQQEIINSLKLKNIHMIVLSEFKSNEPNNTSRSNGVTILDEYIRDNYYLDRSFGNRMVFIEKTESLNSF
jgi:hypothetical protein